MGLLSSETLEKNTEGTIIQDLNDQQEYRRAARGGGRGRGGRRDKRGGGGGGWARGRNNQGYIHTVKYCSLSTNS